MCRVIAVSNQKGGVGKTTTSINLGVGLARMGQRVLLVDSDPQGYLTLGLGFPKNIRVTLKNMMENIIMGIEFDPKEAILHHKEGVDVVPSNKLLTGMDMSLITVDDREKVLKEYLEMMADDYDFIIIDCMPSLGMISGAEYPYQFVKNKLLKLNYSHIQYVLECLHDTTTKVRNVKAYLLTCLFNAPSTIGNYYRAEVNHDMYGGGWSNG